MQDDGVLSAQAVQEMPIAASKPLSALTRDDCRKYAPLLGVARDPFTLTLSELFLSYYTRFEENSNAQWRKEKGKRSGDSALTDEDFAAQYGPAPWDLLNEALSLTGLKYQVNHPEDIGDDIPYEVRLTQNETGVRIQTSELSSGERALMVIAVSLYVGSSLSASIQLPRVLLLDEPDASLHPSMVRSLLRVIEDIFCKRHGVKVILTTHSPTTVALAPEESLYVMSRNDAPRIRSSASRDEALRGLMVGLPTLSVRNENRRQVFVESDDDEGCYQDLFRLPGDKLTTPFSLEFIASGRRGAGSDVAVKDLVQKLRASGNKVQGILDRDKRSGAPEGIVFIEKRRALENLVLDPLLVGILLLREDFASPKEVFGETLRHFQVEAQHAQAICNYVIGRIREDDYDEENVSVSYVGGFELSMPKFCLDMNGHDLEKRYKTCFPQLERCRNGLKAKVIDAALGDVPSFAPLDVVELVQKLSSRA